MTDAARTTLAGKDQLNFTDADSRTMKTNDDLQPRYSAQAGGGNDSSMIMCRKVSGVSSTEKNCCRRCVKRTPPTDAFYNLRQQTIEPVVGIIKSAELPALLPTRPRQSLKGVGPAVPGLPPQTVARDWRSPPVA